MRLKRLTIDRLPGIDQPFKIESEGTGVHVIFGPNAIGKSSICRAVEGLYWDDRGPTERTCVIGQFELDGETWRAERDGSRLRWRCGGEDRLPPDIPASHYHRCFFLRLRDLIDPSPEGTQDIASDIRRQMSGGFDLNRIVEDLFPRLSKRHGRRQRVEFNAAMRAVQKAEGEQLGLQRRADKLETLGKKLEATLLAARRLPSVERAVGLANRRKEHARVVEEIAALPGALANLTGQEVEQINRHQTRIDDLSKRARDLESERDAALSGKHDSRLPAEVNKSELAVWRQNAEELGRVELELKTARTLRSECHEELGAALSALGGGDVDKVALTVREHGRLFEFLRAAEKHRAQKNAIEERLRLLAHIEHSEDGQSHLETLRGTVDALRRWLRSPEPETLRDRLRARRAWILLAVVMAIAGAGLAVFVDPRFGLLLAAGAGVMVPVILLRGTNAASDTRANAQKAFTRFDVQPPDAWDTGSVESQLRNLEVEVASIDSRLQRARDRNVDRQNLKSQLDAVVEEETQLNEERGNLLECLKLDSIPPDAELVDIARALDQLRAARIKYEGASGRVDDIEATHAQLLSNLSVVLQRHGEPAPEDTTTAKAYLGNLSDRNAQLVKALADESQAEAQLEQNSADQQETLDSIRQIYTEASLNDGDLPGLTALLKLLPQYRELKEKANRLDAQIDLDRNELEKADEAELVNCVGTTLDRQVKDLSAAAGKVDELRGEIADINAQVNAAKRGSNLQDLIGRREKARAELQGQRDEAIFARAGRFLVDSVEKEYEQHQMPRVFERARDHFF